MNTQVLDNLEKLYDSTTKGQWVTITKGNSVKSHAIESLSGKVCSGISPKSGNAAFIEAAHEYMPALIAQSRLAIRLAALTPPATPAATGAAGAGEAEEMNDWRIQAISSALTTFPSDFAYRTASDLGYWVCTARDLVEALKVALSLNEALTQQRDYGRDIIAGMTLEAAATPTPAAPAVAAGAGEAQQAKSSAKILEKIGRLKALKRALGEEAALHHRTPYALQSLDQRAWDGEANVAQCRALQSQINALEWCLSDEE